jgi:opacity protein-like surface antigen
LPSNFEHLDFIGGVRYIFLDTQLVFTPGPTLGSDHDWIGPLVGARYQNSLAENWHYHLRGDIGGFGVSSELVLNLMATLGYKFNNTFGVDLGYRFLNIDFKENDFIYDASMQGIVVGLGIHF